MAEARGADFAPSRTAIPPLNQESKMKMSSRSGVLLLALALSMAALGGCADVRQAPADNVVNGQADQPAPQVADVAPRRQSSVPF
jgi:hypothetical protein